jgi:ABC-type thiamine transport system ATPase subunit
MDKELFENVTEEVMISLGLSASYRLTAVSREKAQEDQKES